MDGNKWIFDSGTVKYQDNESIFTKSEGDELRKEILMNVKNITDGETDPDEMLAVSYLIISL